MAPGAVEEARDYRDALWELVKARYIAHLEIPAEEAQAYAEALEDLPASLEGAVEEADNVADRRFDKAEAAGELAVLAHNIAGHETRIGQLEADEAALRAVAERQNKIEELEQDQKASWASMQPLLEAAGVEDVKELREAIERSDRLRTLNEKLGGAA